MNMCGRMALWEVIQRLLPYRENKAAFLSNRCSVQGDMMSFLSHTFKALSFVYAPVISIGRHQVKTFKKKKEEEKPQTD